MRYVGSVGTGMLLSAAVFSSCTCQKQVSTPPPSTFEAPSGFHVSGPKITPLAHVVAQPATPVPTAAQMAQGGPTPTAAAPVAVPADFPADVPIFKDAALAQVQDLANNAHNVIFTTPAPLPDVAGFYQERMGKAGWKVTQQFQRSDHAFFTFQKGNMIANLTVAPDVNDPSKQIIAIMYEQEKPLDFDEF
jgi:hypothetical protein